MLVTSRYSERPALVATRSLLRFLAILGAFLRPTTLAFADTSPPPGEGDPPGDEPPEGDPPTDELVKEFGEKGAAEIRRLRGENAGHRTKNRELSTKLTDIERAQLTEAEQAKARADDAEKKAQEAVTRAQAIAIAADIRVHAATAGAVDVDAVVALVDRSSIEADDDGNVKGGKAAVDALLKSKPFLVAPGGPGRNGANFDGGPGDKPPGVTDMNRRIRQQAGYGS